MKRFYSFLATMIMMITAATSVSAKDYYSISETPLSEIEDGMTVVIRGSFKNKYACSTGSTTIVSDDCLFKLVKVGQTSEGYNTYNVQHVKTGQYLNGGTLTSDQTSATKFTIEQAVCYETMDEISADPVHGTLPACQGTPVEWEGAFIFGNSDDPNSTLAMYYDTEISMWNYRDTNAMYLYEFALAHGRARAELMMSDLFPNEKPTEDVFTAGEGIGQVPQNYYDALVAARTALDEIRFDGNDHSEAEYDAAADALEAAYEACVANRIAMAEGFYRFRCDGRNVETGYAYTSGGSTKWVTGTYTVPETLTPADAAYIWEFIKAPDTDGGYYIRNMRENKYVTYVSTTSASQALNDEPSTVWYIVSSPANSKAFAFRSGDDMSQGLHAQGGGTIVRWDYTTQPSAWYIESVAAADVEALQQQVEQALLNDKLSSLLSDAVGDYEVGNVRTPIAKEMTADDVWTNAQEASEGPIANAVDKNEDGTPNYSTFFHSSWSNSGMADIHNFCADMGEAYKELQIQITDRANSNTYNRPTIVNLYGANEIAEGDSLAGDSWHYAGRFNVAYNDTVMFNGRELGVGKVTAYFAVPYRYIRMDAVTVKNKNNETTKFFTASNVAFANEIDEEKSLNNTIPSEYTAPIAAAIQKAVAEIAAGAATEATYDELKEAYDLYLSAYPDPNVLASLLEDVKAVVAGISSEKDEPGYFDETFDAAEFQGKLDEIEGNISSGDIISYADAVAYKATLRDILAQINAAVKRPEAGLYRLTSQSTNENIFGNMVYAVTASESRLSWSGSATDANFKDDLRGIWNMTVNEDNTITLQNMFSGYYMGKVVGEDLSTAIKMSKEPVNIDIEYSGTPGCFNIVQEEGRYMNTDPTGAIVTWSSRGDNSLFTFSDQAFNPWEGAHSFPLSAANPTIVTLPFAVDNDPMECVFAEIVGINREAGTLELNDVADDVIEAGTPFIVIPDEEVTSILFMLSEAPSPEDLANVNYTDEATAVNGLVGALKPVTIENRELKIGMLNNAPILTYLDAKSEIAATSGYITLNGMPEVTEQGTYHIAIHENALTGIENIVANGTAKKQAIYDLSGRRVQKLQKGLYIVNGKKVLVK